MQCSSHTTDFALDATATSIFGVYPSPMHLLLDKKALSVLKAAIKTPYNKQKAKFILASTQSLALAWWEKNGDGSAFHPKKIEGVQLIEDDFELLLAQMGVGRKVAAMVLYVVHGKTYAMCVDRHVRRFLIALGIACSRCSDVKISIMAQSWFARDEWVNVNYVAAGIAQQFYTLRNKSEIARIQHELIAIAHDYGHGEDMRNFLLMN